MAYYVGLFFVVVLLGYVLGWVVGTTAEQKLWLDAICGREKLLDRNTKEHP